MTAIANVSQLINRLTGGNNGNPENESWAKSFAAGVFLGGVYNSTWLHEGYPGQGATPTAAAVPTRATAGAARHLNPTGGRQRWLRSFSACGWGAARVILYDRLLHCGGLSGTVTGAQAVGTNVTRYTGAESFGNLILAEIYAGVGNAVHYVSCNYLDSTGTARASNAAQFGGTAGKNPGNCVIIPYNNATGANSVTQVVDASLDASLGAPSGNWGITIARPLAEVQIGSVDASGFGSAGRMLISEDVEIKTDACLGILWVSCASSMTFLRGSYTTVES